MALERKGRRGVRRGELTPGEIESAASDADAGGFSRRMTGPGVGKTPRNIFSTGFAPESGRAAEVPIDTSKSSASQLKQFIQNKASTWATRGADWVLGGWNDNGTVQLDTSVATPRTTEGFGSALQMGSYADQDSVGELGNKKQGYMGDIKIPSHLSRSQFYAERGVPVPENEGFDPTVTRNLYEGKNPRNGQPQLRERVKIEPSRKEMVQVEAEEVAKEKGLK